MVPQHGRRDMAIPKVIHRIWFGPRPMPQSYRAYGHDWIELNPGWKLIDWNYDTLPELINQHWFDTCGTAWRPGRGDAKEATMIQVTQADIASYEILHQHGGLYVNCDMQPISPLPDLTEVDVLLAYEIDGWLISNAFMAATPNHPLMQSVINAIPGSIQANQQASMDWITGPKLLTAVKKELHDDVFVLPARACNPFMPDQQPVVYPETICQHHWGHAAKDEELWPDLPRQEGQQRYN